MDSKNLLALMTLMAHRKGGRAAVTGLMSGYQRGMEEKRKRALQTQQMGINVEAQGLQRQNVLSQIADREASASLGNRTFAAKQAELADQAAAQKQMTGWGKPLATPDVANANETMLSNMPFGLSAMAPAAGAAMRKPIVPPMGEALSVLSRAKIPASLGDISESLLGVKPAGVQVAEAKNTAMQAGVERSIATYEKATGKTRDQFDSTDIAIISSLQKGKGYEAARIGAGEPAAKVRSLDANAQAAQSRSAYLNEQMKWIGPKTRAQIEKDAATAALAVTRANAIPEQIALSRTRTQFYAANVNSLIDYRKRGTPIKQSDIIKLKMQGLAALRIADAQIAGLKAKGDAMPEDIGPLEADAESIRGTLAEVDGLTADQWQPLSPPPQWGGSGKGTPPPAATPAPKPKPKPKPLPAASVGDPRADLARMGPVKFVREYRKKKVADNLLRRAMKEANVSDAKITAAMSGKG